MKPKHAIKHLQLIADSQKTISTNKLQSLVNLAAAYTKMLETDNKKLRRKIKRQRVVLRKQEDAE